MSETRQARASWLHARFAPSTYDADARTVEVVWSTGAPVRRRDWDGEYTEILSMAPDAVDMARLSSGAPVLNAHNAYDLKDVLGVVERAWLDNDEGRAVLRFSERADVAPVLSDIRAGILRNISVGYDVMEWKEGKDAKGKRVKTAVRWQPAEISLVPVPADASAQIRAAETPSGAGSDDHNNPSAADAAEETDMANPATPAPDTAPINADVIASEARAAERARAAELRGAAALAVRSRLLPEERVTALEAEAIESGATVETFRARMFNAAAEAAPTAPAPRPVQMGASGDDPAAIIEAMATAIAVRAGGVGVAVAERAKDQRWREFAAMRPSDMIMELAAARGERISPRMRHEMVMRSFHTTSDFPLLLENAGNKMLEAGFALAAPSYRRWMARRPFNDFKAHSFLTAGDFPALNVLGEGGEIQAGTISENRERITALTYARQVRVTRQMLVNDDLGAFTDFGAMIGRRVADQENALAYAQVNLQTGDGPTLAEGNARVFATTAGRVNKAASGTAITEAALDAGYTAIMGQTSLDGLRLNLMPRFLLTGAAYRGAALRFTARLTADVATNVGLYSDMEPLADANIPGNRWYMFADPASAPTYVYGYVNGQEAPQVRVQQYVPGTDGIALDVVHDFAVGAIGWRGAWFNPGA